eukprot:CAMPEP_0170518836 /NCGR_PEP_ID=MMETSP0209-20121228/4434_1 /TAXON_ID=665100 ORGANISM="Litonotus pictus, Strain P1" /NCGR_SAMPLE_ID=MMETSP0209 /ASSEMBLY_ACC=CAM_ASM_000301 /LENGTH=377 /DNA_ID=CAMNT_0010804539 /DNA_START=128 /DNA_END=1261 /DNA_ORIENTATION=-
MDSYYRVISSDERKNLANFNFDHPSAFDFDLLLIQLRQLLNGETIEMPIYDFTTSSRKEETETRKPSHLIIFEGIFAMYDERIRNIMDMMIFVDTDDDVRLARRIYRDVRERGRTLRSIIDRYNKFVKPAFEEYIRPQRKFADIIIPKGSENKVAIELVCTNLKSQLDKRLSLEANVHSTIKFIPHDIFDNRTFNPELVHIINDEHTQFNLKSILEDCVNKKRPQYNKLFANELVQSLIDLYTSEEELESCYIVDEIHEINEKILSNSKNTLIFRNSLISDVDLSVIKSKVHFASKHCKNITIMAIFLSPEIVKTLLIEYPGVNFYTIFHSNLFDSKIKLKIQDQKGGDYSYSKEFLGSESMCQIFRKLMFSYFDDE